MRLHDRVFPDISIHTQATGRWSITNPNLQGLKGDISDIYVPDRGMVALKHDWDAIELRIQASLANDKPLLDAFANKWEPHTLNTCDVLGYPHPPNKSNPHTSPECEEWRRAIHWQGKEDIRRRFGKMFVFRLIYRGDPKHAGDIPGAKQLGLTASKLQQAANNWLLAHPAIRTYWARVEEQVRAHLWTKTWTGRKRRYQGISPEALMKRVVPASVMREACNHPIQGGVSDLKNLCIIEIIERCPWVTLWKEQHDAFWLECPEAREAETWPVYQQVVQQPRVIEGVTIQFPADFKRYLPNGTSERVVRL
jgi:DNA polymerase I-like protein with 3'-5' exonuclease and polymerase domains